MQSLYPASKELLTERLRIQSSQQVLAEEALDFFSRNRNHLTPWDPPWADDFLTRPFHAQRLERSEQEFDSGTAYRYWMRQGDQSTPRVIGCIHISNVVRGAFHSAMLGYCMDGMLQGRGLMTEALRAVITEMFSPRVRLHRLQANHMPENLRSAAVLMRLGFQTEGLAPSYLFINGAWRDHVVTARINEDFDLAATAR